MLMSKNPNGDIEVYTDIGQFIGILPPDYPGVDTDEFADDGGPGSGNWDHKERQGKRGGSGKGGGIDGFNDILEKKHPPGEKPITFY